MDAKKQEEKIECPKCHELYDINDFYYFNNCRWIATTECTKCYNEEIDDKAKSWFPKKDNLIKELIEWLVYRFKDFMRIE